MCFQLMFRKGFTHYFKTKQIAIYCCILEIKTLFTIICFLLWIRIDTIIHNYFFLSTATTISLLAHRSHFYWVSRFRLIGLSKILPLFLVMTRMTLIRAKVVITHLAIYGVILNLFTATTTWHRHIHFIIEDMYPVIIIIILELCVTNFGFVRTGYL